MTKALSYQEVKEFVESEGYILLSNEYKTAKHKILFKCPKGHTFHSTYSSFKNGSRCPFCFEERRKGSSRKRWNKENIEDFVTAEGYTLMGIDYKYNRKILHLVCPNGHAYQTNLFSFVLGHRCKKCAGLKKRTDNYLEIINYYKSHSLVETSKKYNIIPSKVTMIFQHVYGMSKRQWKKENR